MMSRENFDSLGVFASNFSIEEKGNGAMKITNTKNLAEERPLTVLGEAIKHGTEDAILKMEAAGAYQLRNQREVLPTNGLEKREIWEAMGIVVGEKVDDDSLFTHVVLPDGWTLTPSDSNPDYWTELRDVKKRLRANIFYKAAFYDRKAFIRPLTRYAIHSVADWLGEAFQERVVDLGVDEQARTLFVTKECSNSDEADQEAALWLNQHFPDWKNPLAYWE